MKLAVLSDIHSNVFALQAVLSHAGRRGVDQLINLGDILYGPIAPRATYDLLQKHNFVTISGNQDRQIWQADKQAIDSNPTMQFILQDLGPEPLDWMRQLPFDYQLNEDVYLCHGTPANDLIYLLEQVESGRPVLRDDAAIIELLAGQTAPVILCGHTHIPRSVRLSTGQVIVNPGSVGLPAYTDDEPCSHSMENYSPHASYALLEKRHDQWLVEHIKVPYDVESAVAAAQLRGRQDWVHFLSTGRGLR
ncbi:MAG: metallophosphatase family protein [Oceanospirillum sp.]|nr:metallophosphatase family protein [Oceanospirillum sp.]